MRRLEANEFFECELCKKRATSEDEGIKLCDECAFTEDSFVCPMCNAEVCVCND